MFNYLLGEAGLDILHTYIRKAGMYHFLLSDGTLLLSYR